MPGRRFPRLEAILGKPLADLDPEAIRLAVEEGVPENDQLDWKREHHERTTDGRTELAKDVCALANHQGGALIFGVADNDGVAAKAMPVDVSDDQQRHIRSVLVSNTAPMPRVDLIALEDGDREGFLVLVVEPSGNAPHAVSAPGSPSLIYPVRHGTQTRYLSEAEVAEAYGRRLERITSRRERLGDLLEEGWGQLTTEAIWTVLALTPAVPGEMDLGWERHRELRDWLDGVAIPSLTGSGYGFRTRETGTGLGRAMYMGGRDDEGRALGTYVELHTDGSSFLAMQQWQDGGPLDEQAPEEEWLVYDEAIVEDTVGMFEVACRHAIENAGAWSEATATVTVMDPGADVPVVGTRHPVALAHSRGFGRRNVIARTSKLEWTPHTVDMESGLNGPALLGTVRLLTRDLVQSLGVPELWQIDPEGRLRRRYFARSALQEVERWAEHHGVELTDETI